MSPPTPRCVFCRQDLNLFERYYSPIKNGSWSVLTCVCLAVHSVRLDQLILNDKSCPFTLHHMSTLQLLVCGTSILTMPPCGAEYFCLNDPHQLTHIDLPFDLIRVCARVRAKRALACGWVSVSVCVFEPTVGLRTRASLLACVLMSGCLCACVRGSVCVFMWLHVFCPLKAYLYPCRDIHSRPRLSGRVQAGPGETRWRFHLFWEFSLFKPVT